MFSDYKGNLSLLKKKEKSTFSDVLRRNTRISLSLSMKDNCCEFF